MTKKRPPWRPSKYEDTMPARVLSLMQDGASKTEVASELGITRETLYDWCDPESPRYQEAFSDAIKTGETLSQAWWEKQVRLGIWGGKQFNSTAFIFVMKNRFPEDWREKPVMEANKEAQGNIDELLKVLKRDQ